MILFAKRPKLYISLTVAIVAAVAGSVSVHWNGLTLYERWSELRSGVIFVRGASDRKIVALTFDDGPDPRYTPRILDILKQHNVPATFFLCGKSVRLNPNLARRIASEGHTVGNHTFSH